METVDEIKISLFKKILAAIAVVTVMYLTCSCAEGLDIQTDFDFNISAMPVPKKLQPLEEVEIRLEIRSIGGSYDSAKYYVRYFPTEGTGRLRLGDSILRPNDLYLIKDRTFKMYYTAISEDTHTIDLFFTDNFSHEHALDFTFNKKDTTNQNI